MSSGGIGSGRRKYLRGYGWQVRNAEEHFVKAQLMFKIDIRSRRERRMKVKTPLVCSASANLMFRRCCGVSSASFQWKGCCVFLSRSGRMWRLLSGRTGTRNMRRSCGSLEGCAELQNLLFDER